jgi:thiamine-monophosphate kinase
LVTINASDLAAAGAAPLGFLAAVECPSETDVSDFKRFLEGVRDSCAAQDLRYCGGNLREAARLSAVGTAVGWTQDWRPLQRSGAQAGNVLMSIGYGGVFWGDVFRVRAGGKPDPSQSPLYAPKSQLRVMKHLARENLIKAAMDNSDGLLPTLVELARHNALRVTLDLDQIALHAEGSDDQSLRKLVGVG